MQQRLNTPNTAVIVRARKLLGAIVAIMVLLAAGGVLSTYLLVNDVFGPSIAAERSLSSLLPVLGSFVCVPFLLIMYVIRLIVLRFDIGTSRRPAHVWASSAGVFLDGQLAIPAGAIVEGYALRATYLGCVVVEINRRGGDMLRLAVRDVGEGRRLLCALGLDASQRTTSFRSPSWAQYVFQMVPGLSVSIYLVTLVGNQRLDHDVVVSIDAAIGSALLLWGVLRCFPARIDVGFDGVRTGWLGFHRFVSYADLRVVDLEGGFRGSPIFLRFKLATGTSRRVPVPRARDARIADRIRQAKESYDAGAMPAASPPT